MRGVVAHATCVHCTTLPARLALHQHRLVMAAGHQVDATTGTAEAGLLDVIALLSEGFSHQRLEIGPGHGAEVVEASLGLERLQPTSATQAGGPRSGPERPEQRPRYPAQCAARDSLARGCEETVAALCQQRPEQIADAEERDDAQDHAHGPGHARHHGQQLIVRSACHVPLLVDRQGRRSRQPVARGLAVVAMGDDVLWNAGQVGWDDVT